MVESFGQRLRERLLDAGPLCVGVDPSAEVLSSWERPDNVEGLEYVARTLVDVAVGQVAVLKFQVAFFERFASAGLRILERTMHDAREGGAVIIADAKRGDVGSSNEGYATAWLDDASPLRADAVTVSPYLGVDALEPFFHLASSTGRGIFVLAATSNPEGRSIQLARTDRHDRVETSILGDVARRNASFAEPGPYGVVLGATRERPEFDLATLGGPVLVPGVGAQGAAVSDVARLCERCPTGTVVVNVSRAISGAGPERRRLRDALWRWRDDVRILT